jgi:DNA-nicking Smr family endonuclease
MFSSLYLKDDAEILSKSAVYKRGVTMDFEDILDEWERMTAIPQGSKKQLKKQAEGDQADASRSSAGHPPPKPDEARLKKVVPGFGDILDEWERMTAIPQGSKKQLKKRAERAKVAASRSSAKQPASKPDEVRVKKAAPYTSAKQPSPKPDEACVKKAAPYTSAEQSASKPDEARLEKAAPYTSAKQPAPKLGEARLERADPLTAWLRIHGVYNKDTDAEASTYETGADAGKRRRRLLQKKPDAVIDLHGLTQAEAWNALDNFFEDSRQHGFEKLCIIHGKGNHSDGNAVLKQLTRRFIECCPFAGESGHGNAASGGSGATWVILKRGGTC